MNAIEVRDVTKAYGEKVAVADLSFTVGRGEIFGLLGPNGAGKTTTVRVVLDLIAPTSGQVRVLGGPMSAATKRRIGYLPEERGLYRDVGVLEGLEYLASLKGLSRGDARQRARAGLERVGLEAVARQPVRALSRGMQQKVQLLAAILHEPALLIIDEPFSGLDPVNARLMRDLLLELRERGTTIVMSTHQMNRVEELCERMLMLQGGRMVLYGVVEEIRALFGGDSVLLDADGDVASLRSVEALTARNGALELTLRRGVQPADLLRELSERPDLVVRRFEVHAPSLEEIFIAVAGGAP